jgi:hypothetical protein
MSQTQEVAPRTCYICAYGAANTEAMPMCDWCKYLLHKEAFGKRAGTEMATPPPPPSTPPVVSDISFTFDGDMFGP